MAQTNSAIIFWVGDYGAGDKHIKPMRFPWIEGAYPQYSHVGTLKTALSAYTDANQGDHERIQKAVIPHSEPDVGANLDVKARIAFKDSDDGKIYRVELPAPKATIFEQQGEGDRVKQADLIGIVDAISTAYSKTFIPLWGKKIQRS